MEDLGYNYEMENRVKTMSETDKKCPSCGGVMDFDPATGGLLCPFCGKQVEIPAADATTEAAQELDFDSVEKTGNCDWGVKKKTVTCKSCGAVSVYDDLEVANVCPYCDSNQVMEAHDTDTLAPGGVCVFKVTTEQAAEKFHKWLKGKLFTPSKAKKSAKPDAFKGVYLPYWTFDADTHSNYSGRYGIEYTRRDSKGNTTTHVKWYPISGTYDEFIDDQLVCGTNRYDDVILGRIEPFNTADNKVYRPEYVAGFIAERYSVGIKDAWQTGKEDIKDLLESHVSSQIRSTKNADRVDVTLNTIFSNIKYKYLLLPIWISSFKYKEKLFQFMVNGQTGQVGGKAPVSPLRVAIAIVIGLAILAGIIYLCD